MPKTYSKDQIQRIQYANAAINRLEAAKLGQHGEIARNCNDAIKRWKTTIAFIEEEK